MEDGGSIVEFFYNLVPGALFLFLLQYFGIIPYFNGSDIFLIFLYVVISLFWGFVFQGCTVLLRKKILCWNKKSFDKVEKENPKLFKSIKTFLKKSKKLDKLEAQNVFYLMDTGLRREVATFLPSHFSSLFTFWANIFSGIIIFFGIYDIYQIFKLFSQRNFCFNFTFSLYLIVILLLIIFLIVSYLLAEYYLKTFYATMLNCYYMKNKADIDNS